MAERSATRERERESAAQGGQLEPTARRLHQPPRASSGATQLPARVAPIGADRGTTRQHCHRLICEVAFRQGERDKPGSFVSGSGSSSSASTGSARRNPLDGGETERKEERGKAGAAHRVLNALPRPPQFRSPSEWEGEGPRAVIWLHYEWIKRFS